MLTRHCEAIGGIVAAELNLKIVVLREAVDKNCKTSWVHVNGFTLTYKNRDL